MNPDGRQIGLASEDADALAADVQMLMANPGTDLSVLQPPTLEEWMNFFRAYVGEERRPFDDEMVRRALGDDAAIDAWTRFPAGSECCPTIMPCDITGDRFDRDDIENGHYFMPLLLAPPSVESMNTFFLLQRRLYQFMPVEIQRDCTFDIGPASKVDLCTRYARALANLQFYTDRFFRKR